MPLVLRRGYYIVLHNLCDMNVHHTSVCCSDPSIGLERGLCEWRFHARAATGTPHERLLHGTIITLVDVQNLSRNIPESEPDTLFRRIETQMF